MLREKRSYHEAGRPQLHKPSKAPDTTPDGRYEGIVDTCHPAQKNPLEFSQRQQRRHLDELLRPDLRPVAKENGDPAQKPARV